MKSMTGYGTSRLSDSSSSIEVSIRSVNGRYFEPRFHLPKEFMSLESDLRQILNQYFHRGTTDIFISKKVKSKSHVDIQVNHSLVKEYLSIYKKISKEFKIPYQIHLENLMRAPEVISLEEKTEVLDSEKKLLLKAFKAACLACDKERQREGKSLQTELILLVQNLEKEVRTMESFREDANNCLQERYEQKIKLRISENMIDPQRLAQEVVMQLEKADINEEISRLNEHIKNYRHLLSSSNAEGKKLDFYTQELLREVNTIGSKSQVAKITQSVIEAKSIIEKLREQIQNVQ